MTNAMQFDHQSLGALPGQSGIHTCMTNTSNTPVEALERAYPMRVLRYRLRRGSGGAGLGPGGEGIERDLEMLEDVTVSVITERRHSQPWGLWGGEPGAVGGELAPARRRRVKSSAPARQVDRSAQGRRRVAMLTPGGGGRGTPS
jgi:N-methylhydantoinase B/oxoprolinase/acetone carboxylase alpha subunit